MNKAVLVAALCSLTLSACLGEAGPKAKAPKITEGRATMAKIGGRPLPVFEFSAKVAEEENKIVGARALVSITSPNYKSAGDEGYQLVEPKTLEAEYVANVHQVRATVDPAKEEAMASYLNEDSATVAFQIEIDWTAPNSTEKQTTRSVVFSTDHETIAGAGLGKEIK